MGLTGNLKTMALSELLQWVGLGLKTGTIVISGAGIEKKIFFSEGKILSSSSSDPREYLGHFLVSHGYISEEELRKAMQVQEESNILLGKILVMIGAISEPDLMRLMRLKVEESIYDIFLWIDGDFQFKDGELPDVMMIPLSVDVTGIIMEGLRRWDEWKRIRERISSNGAIPIILGVVETRELSEHDRVILPFVNGRRSIEEIALQTHNPEYHVAKFVYDLLLDGLAKVESPASAPSPIETPASPQEDEIEALVRRAREYLEGGDSVKCWRTLRAALELDPQAKGVKDSLKEAEQAVLASIEESGITGFKIPFLKVSIGEITQLNFTPNEGFILSRISGTWDVKSILKISPIREIDALLIFQKLLVEGIIALR